MSNPQERPSVLLLAATEALAARKQAAFSRADLDAALAWLTEPARSEVVEALGRNGWLDLDRGTYRLTEAGLRSYEAFQRATGPQLGTLLPGFAREVGPERIVGALLRRGRAELAALGREALLPIVPPSLLMSTDAVAQSAESHSLGNG